MNEKLGVLLIDVPEPRYEKYTFLEYSEGSFSTFIATTKSSVIREAYKCTEEEAEKYPQFRWVALEDL